MALLFCDSFDAYATADILKKWGTMTLGSTPVAPAITSAAARSGSQGLRISLTASGEDGNFPLVTVAPGTTASGVCGCAVRMSAGSWSLIEPGTASEGSALFTIIDAGSAQLSLRINADGTLTVCRGPVTSAVDLGTTSAALPTSGWTFVEMSWTINNTTGAAEVRFNETPVLTLSSVDTQDLSTSTWGTFGFARVSHETIAGTLTLDFDDVYLCDQSGVNNTFLGDVRIDAYLPTAAGTSSGWTRSTGADQWATIDDVTPNDDTDYNSAATAPLTDTLNFPALTTVGSPITALQVCVTAKKTDAGSGALAAVVRHGSTDYAATAQGVSVDYLTHRFCYDTNPGTSAAWTESDVNAAEFGYRKTA